MAFCLKVLSYEKNSLGFALSGTETNLSLPVSDINVFLYRNLPFLFLWFWTGVSADITSYRGIRELKFHLHFGMNEGKNVVKHECPLSGSRNKF